MTHIGDLYKNINNKKTAVFGTTMATLHDVEARGRSTPSLRTQHTPHNSCQVEHALIDAAVGFVARQHCRPASSPAGTQRQGQSAFLYLEPALSPGLGSCRATEALPRRCRGAAEALPRQLPSRLPRGPAEALPRRYRGLPRLPRAAEFVPMRDGYRGLPRAAEGCRGAAEGCRGLPRAAEGCKAAEGCRGLQAQIVAHSQRTLAAPIAPQPAGNRAALHQSE